jgi:2-polyprenyl-6-methoxyphenol hydroxylase-like FAD-dependent oxidoreductase
MPISGAHATLETPVLIVGAGPTGLALAGDLGRRGVRCILIEEGRAETEHPRASRLDVRTMELMRRWGIAKAVRETAAARGEVPGTALYCTSLSGYEIARIEHAHDGHDDPGDVFGPASPERAQRCNQLWLDPILREFAGSHDSVRVLFEWRLDRLVERGDCVLAEVTDLAARERRRIAAQYVVDCTGAHSLIRTSIGIAPPEGEAGAYHVSALVSIADLARQHDRGAAGLISFVDAKGIWRTLEMLDARGLWLLDIQGREHWEAAETLDISGQLEETVGRAIAHRVQTVKRWEERDHLARRWREGNILMAGDAAHQVRVASGLGIDAGLGLGLADAFDLAWKLEGRLAGWGLSGLVDAYETERRAARQRFTAIASTASDTDEAIRSHADIALDTKTGGAARKAMGKAIERRPRRGAPHGLSLGCRYAPSAIVAGDGTPEPVLAPFRYQPTTWPGARAPHAALPGGISTLDLFGRGFVLLRLGTRAPEPGGFDRAFAHRGVPLSYRTIEDPAIARLYERRLVLVRPDGHVAWRGDEPPADPLAIVDRVRGAA